MPRAEWPHENMCSISFRLSYGKFDFFKLHDYCYERGFTIYPGKMFGLETFGQLLAHSLFNHARAGKTDQGIWFGRIDVAQHGKTG